MAGLLLSRVHVACVIRVAQRGHAHGSVHVILHTLHFAVHHIVLNPPSTLTALVKRCLGDSQHKTGGRQQEMEKKKGGTESEMR